MHGQAIHDCFVLGHLYKVIAFNSNLISGSTFVLLCKMIFLLPKRIKKTMQGRMYDGC